MYEIMIEIPFSAAHHLENYAGRCARVHGHCWKVRIFVRGEETNQWGVLVPAGDLRRLLQSILQRFDRSYLNQDPLFSRNNPSAEILASWIYKTLSPAPFLASSSPAVRLDTVEVEETPGSVARHLSRTAQRLPATGRDTLCLVE